MLIHFPATWDGVGGAEMRIQEWKALEAFQKAGKARAIGVSHYCQHHLEDLIPIATVPIAVNQVRNRGVVCLPGPLKLNIRGAGPIPRRDGLGEPQCNGRQGLLRCARDHVRVVLAAMRAVRNPGVDYRAPRYGYRTKIQENGRTGAGSLRPFTIGKCALIQLTYLAGVFEMDCPTRYSCDSQDKQAIPHAGKC